MLDELKLFTGNANPVLAQEISRYLKTPLSKAEVGYFPDGETFVKIEEDVRGADTFVIQSTCPPVNKNLMELLVMADALKRASARRITAVIPYYGYARQDRKVEPRVPITAKLVANLITVAGADRILVMDLHVGQIQGFFDIPVDHLFAAPVLINYFRKKRLKNLAIVSPDPGGVERAVAFAKRLSASLAIIDKRRPQASVAKIMNVIGEVKNKSVILVDDMIDTGGTTIKAAEVLKKKGAANVYICCTHPVFSRKASRILQKSLAKEVVVTNTIPFNEDKGSSKITVLSVADLLGEAIRRIHRESSLSSLFV